MKLDIIIRTSIAVSGFCFGFAAAMKVLEKRYDALVEERVAACKESYEETIKDLKEQLGNKHCSSELTEEVEEPEAPKVVNYRDISRYHENVERYSTITKKEPEEVTTYDGPFVISPEEYGEEDGFRTESLSYYADKILADEDDHKIDNVDRVVGIESLSHFGDYEADAVHVRNPRLKCDYEILLDPRRFIDL